MIKIDYPEYAFRFKSENDNEMIFDELRKSWLRLTPEEWVRQNFVQFLVSKNYPAALIAIEKKIMVGEMVKRFDILVFDRQHQPLMMVECKAMNVVLGEEVLRQVLRYHVAVPVTFLVITNGTYCMVFKKEERELVPLDEFPDFK
jgi:hypothetical protein